MRDLAVFTCSDSGKKFAIKKFDVRCVNEIDNKTTSISYDTWINEHELAVVNVVGSFEETVAKVQDE
jgi:hypothetical protein